jgi:hypothetical protein
MRSVEARLEGRLLAGRFTLERFLGQGAMGVVHEAHDHERGTRVALKAMRRLDPALLERLKVEFRTLADVSHPHLVTLHELVAEDDEWFFTMELIEGVDFLSYVRGLAEPVASLPAAVEAAGSGDGTFDTLDLGAIPAPLPWDLAEGRVGGTLDEARLRSALRQLASGVHALHERRLLHRDIKPSNILVARDGRVVLIDFGVIAEVARLPLSSMQRVGTPAYAAPEQARGDEAPTEAADWYSVGVLLYQALAGRLPIPADAKALGDVRRPIPPARTFAPDAPADLDELALELLAEDARRRPSESDVLRRLGVESAGRATNSAAPPAVVVGREGPLAELRSALEEVRAGERRSVFVHAVSGMGKSELLRVFLEEAREAGATVLAGRCYERESVPYKAIDNVIDALARLLQDLPERERAALTPPDSDVLARVFPVLRRVWPEPTVPRTSIMFSGSADVHERRLRAVAAFRGLFRRLAFRGPLVVYVDDLQWGDVDSKPFLEALLDGEGAPPLLFVGTYRSDDEERSPLLRSLRRLRSAESGARSIALEALDPEASLRLARAMLTGPAANELGVVVARESRGHPFFLHELSRFVAEAGRIAGSGLSLDGVVRARVEALPSGARRLLQAVAVAGGPLEQSLVLEASDLHEEGAAALHALRAAQLVHVSGPRAGDVLECYHDRIRETVLDSLSPSMREALHLRFAETLAAQRESDLESRARHLLAAGRGDAAAGLAERAAETAEAAFAFDRAVELFQLAHEHSEGEAERERLQRRLADALVNVGRGAEAALLYLELARHASKDDALDLRRRAAFEYLRSGRIVEGTEVLRQVLAEAGLKLSSSSLRALPGLALGRMRAHLRGAAFTRRSESEIPKHVLHAVDVCWVAGVGLGMVDTFRAAELQTRGYLLALAAGEPYRVGRAMCLEAAILAVQGSRARPRALRLVTLAETIARTEGHDDLVAWAEGARSFAEYQVGHFVEANRLARASLTTLRERCKGVSWEAASVELYLMWSLYYLGEFKELSSRVEERFAEAQAKGDLYARVNLSTGVPAFAWLAAGQPAEGRRLASEALEVWANSDGAQLQHYWAMLALAACDLYEGRGHDALHRVRDTLPSLQKALILNVQACQVETIHLHGRALVMAAATDPQPGPLLRGALRLAKKLEHVGLGWGFALARLLQAGVAEGQGHIDEARALWLDAEGRLRSCSMAGFAAAAHVRAQQLIPGEASAALTERALQEVAALGVREPLAFVSTMAPTARRPAALLPA